VCKADNLTTILCRCHEIWKPLGHSRPVTGLLYLYLLVWVCEVCIFIIRKICYPEGSRKLRFPDFITTAQDGGKVVSLTHRPLFFSPYWRYNPLWDCILQPSSGAIASSRTRFLDHTQRRATVGRTPQDE
jgi:hypothetical protein